MGEIHNGQVVGDYDKSPAIGDNPVLSVAFAEGASGVTIPTGGAVGQVLTRTGVSPTDVAWTTVASGGGSGTGNIDGGTPVSSGIDTLDGGTP